MNRYSFSDATSNKRGTLHDDLDVDYDDDDGDQRDAAGASRRMTGAMEGEEVGASKKYKPGADEGDLTAFNLEEEREGDLGHFDGAGNFVFKRKGKDEEEEDSWLSGLGGSETIETAIGEAAAAAKARQLEAKRSEERRRDDGAARKSALELIRNLLLIMRKDESVAQTLRRLSSGSVGGASKAGAAGFVRRRKSDQSHPREAPPAPSVAPETDDPTDSNKKRLLLQVTEIADSLLSRGWSNIYGMKWQHLWVQQWLWEYQDSSGHIQGPFSAKDIGTWKLQGYFTGAGAVLMRPVGPANEASRPKEDYELKAGSKKRVVAFADEEGSAKRMRSSGTGDGHSDQADLLADLDSDSDADADAEAEADGNGNGNGRSACGDKKAKDGDTCTTSAQPGRQWLSSDDWDFGANFPDQVDAV